jgi:hypothetical protein
MSADERTIASKYFVHSGGRVARQGDVVKLSAEDIARGEARGSFEEGAAPAAADPDDLDAFVADATADQVVERAGDDPDLAARLLEAEKAGKNRKTAVEPLEALVEGAE